MTPPIRGGYHRNRIRIRIRINKKNMIKPSVLRTSVFIFIKMFPKSLKLVMTTRQHDLSNFTSHAITINRIDTPFANTLQIHITTRWWSTPWLILTRAITTTGGSTNRRRRWRSTSKFRDNTSSRTIIYKLLAYEERRAGLAFTPGIPPRPVKALIAY